MDNNIIETIPHNQNTATTHCDVCEEENLSTRYKISLWPHCKKCSVRIDNGNSLYIQSPLSKTNNAFELFNFPFTTNYASPFSTLTSDPQVDPPTAQSSLLNHFKPF